MSILGFIIFALLFLRIAHVARHLQTVPVLSAPSEAGQVVFVERRWLSGVITVATSMLFGIGAEWATYGADPLGTQWWIIVPSAGLAVSGVLDLGFQRRHIFYLRPQRVRAERRRFGCVAFERSYEYSQLRWVIEDRSPGKGPWFSALVRYPDFEASFYSATDESKVQRRMNELRLTLQFESEPSLATSGC